MKRGILFFCVGTLAWGGVVVAAGNPVAGKEKSAVCVACHAEDGNSLSPIYPKLAGQHASYLAKQLHDFKNPEARPNAIMAPFVAALSLQDIEDLAAYFASQTTSQNSANPDLVKLGEKLYRGGDLKKGIPACTGCHGPVGEGNALARFPKLAGQHADYTIAQLKAFRAGERKNGVNGMMHDITIKMTDEEIEAVAQYSAGLYRGE